MINFDTIWARAVCETWRERLDSGEITFGEYMKAMKSSRDSHLKGGRNDD